MTVLKRIRNVVINLTSVEDGSSSSQSSSISAIDSDSTEFGFPQSTLIDIWEGDQGLAVEFSGIQATMFCVLMSEKETQTLTGTTYPKVTSPSSRLSASREILYETIAFEIKPAFASDSTGVRVFCSEFI